MAKITLGNGGYVDPATGQVRPVEYNTDGSMFRHPTTGAWVPVGQYFDVFAVGGPVQTGALPISSGVGGNQFTMPRGSAPSFSYQSTPDYGTSSMPGGMMGGGEDDGWWGNVTDWLGNLFGDISGGDWLNAVGTGVGIYMDHQGQERNRATSDAQFRAGLAQRAREFERTQGQREAQDAVRAESQLNRAPMADQAQALLMARMGVAPETFAPRDMTKGTDAFRAGSSGGPGNVTRGHQEAVRRYRPGDGGVRTEALEDYLERMRRSSQSTA